MTQALDEVLAPVAEQLRADGFDLRAAVEAGVVDCDVVAGPEACAECLVPKELLATMIDEHVRAAGIDVARIVVRYPGEG